MIGSIREAVTTMLLRLFRLRVYGGEGYLKGRGYKGGGEDGKRQERL